MKLTPKDRKVLAAFLDGAARTSENLSTDGRRLDGLWMGGAGIAFYTSGGDIAFSDLGSRAAQTIQRAIARAAPGSLDVSAHYVLTPRKRVGSSEARARKVLDVLPNGRRGARLRNHHLQVGDFVKYTPAGRSAFQGGKLFGRARRGTVRDSFGGPNDRYAVAWTDSGGNVVDVPGKYLEREERDDSDGAYFGPVLRNPAAKWTDGDTTSVLSHGHHGRILVTATARYVNRYLGAGEARKGWYALYLSDEPAGPEFWGSGTKAVCLGHAGPYTSRAAAKAAGSKRWKSWGTP